MIDQSDPEPRSLIEFAYGRLRADIVCGRLSPGSRLRIEELRASYALGATPLREALSRLSAVGLVEATAQRGFRVTPVSREDLDDVTLQRTRLETLALTESIGFGDRKWEAAIVAAHYHLSVAERNLVRPSTEAFDEYEARNRDFHEALVANCRSKWTLHFRSLIYDHHERYRRLSMVVSPERAEAVSGEHDDIKNAALARDAQRACELTEVHIKRTVDGIQSKLAKGGEPAEHLGRVLGQAPGAKNYDSQTYASSQRGTA